MYIFLSFKVRPYEIELIRRDYVANGGWKNLLSYEDPEQDILVGLLLGLRKFIISLLPIPYDCLGLNRITLSSASCGECLYHMK